MRQAVYVQVELRGMANTTVSSGGRNETRRIYKRNGAEFIRWQNQWYELHIDPAALQYFVILGTGSEP